MNLLVILLNSKGYRMAKSQEPVVLDLASLPRDQVGPFLLLGLDKTANKEEMEAHWADRIRWARKQQIKVPLEDINWARDVLGDLTRRLRADSASLNADTTQGVLSGLAQRYGVCSGQATRMWQPLDSEKPLADYTPSTEVPDAAEVRSGLTVPAIPEELPAVPTLLERFLQQPLDPWALELKEEG
jgi:hypothetical protein